MKIGIVTTWFERGAAYVSKQFEETLSKEHEVFIYARGGENYAIGDPNWDKENVTWGKKVWLPTVTTPINKNDFIKWIKKNDIQTILFNEQHWWDPLIWCQEIGVTTIAYIDYYKENIIKFYGLYDYLICNTQRHYNTFSWHSGAYFIPWGTDTKTFTPTNTGKNKKTFFHSAGMAPFRKGTDILLKAFNCSTSDWKLIIHTQTDLNNIGNEDLSSIINKLTKEKRLQIINRSVPAPGLYHLGEVYVYPCRLDGIGLTIAESMSCGLIPVLPNNAPMNEFIPKDYSYLVPVKHYFSRSDGYYWPIGEVSPHDLLLKLNKITNLEETARSVLQDKIRTLATEKLSWEINSEKLLILFRKIEKHSEKQVSDISLQNEVKKFSNHGINRFNKVILDFNAILKPIVKISKKLLK